MYGLLKIGIIIFYKLNDKFLFIKMISIDQFIPVSNVEYRCSPLTRSTGFTLLMRLVLSTKQHPRLEKLIDDYLSLNPDEIN